MQGHSANQCTDTPHYKYFKGHHHSLIHENKSIKGRITETKPSVSTSCLKIQGTNCILLSTAIIRLQDFQGIMQPCMATLDAGSQANVITEQLVQHLKLKHIHNVHQISGINNISSWLKTV